MSVNNAYLIAAECVWSVEDTSWNDSRSQKWTVLSRLPLANKNSWGWNSTVVAGPRCSENSLNCLPARRSHSCRQVHKINKEKTILLLSHEAPFSQSVSKTVINWFDRIWNRLSKEKSHRNPRWYLLPMRIFFRQYKLETKRKVGYSFWYRLSRNGQGGTCFI